MFFQLCELTPLSTASQSCATDWTSCACQCRICSPHTVIFATRILASFTGGFHVLDDLLLVQYMVLTGHSQQQLVSQATPIKWCGWHQILKDPHVCHFKLSPLQDQYLAVKPSYKGGFLPGKPACTGWRECWETGDQVWFFSAKGWHPTLLFSLAAKQKCGSPSWCVILIACDYGLGTHWAEGYPVCSQPPCSRHGCLTMFICGAQLVLLACSAGMPAFTCVVNSTMELSITAMCLTVLGTLLFFNAGRLTMNEYFRLTSGSLMFMSGAALVLVFVFMR